MYEITNVTVDVPERPEQTYDVVMEATIRPNHDAIKVRARVHRDNYGFQSWAHAQVWSPTDLRWNAAITELPNEVARHTGDPYARDREGVRNTAYAYAETLVKRTEQLVS
jgi:hypothetical protein